MGELHLEIAADRLRREHNVDVTLGIALQRCHMLVLNTLYRTDAGGILGDHIDSC